VLRHASEPIRDYRVLVQLTWRGLVTYVEASRLGNGDVFILTRIALVPATTVWSISVTCNPMHLAGCLSAGLRFDLNL